MGSHHDGVSIAAGIHTNEFGTVATYTPPGGIAVACEIIPYPVRTERRDSSAGKIEVQVREIIADINDLADPAILGTFVIGGESWTVESRELTPAARWKLSLTKTAAIEVNRAQYRRGGR